MATSTVEDDGTRALAGSLVEDLPETIWATIIGTLKPRHKAALRGSCRRMRALVNTTVGKVKVTTNYL